MKSHISDVGDPELMRSRGREVALDQVRAMIICLGWTGGVGLAAPADPVQPGATHQTSDLIAAQVPACSAHRMPHLPRPVDTIVLRMDALYFRDQ